MVVKLVARSVSMKNDKNEPINEATFASRYIAPLFAMFGDVNEMAVAFDFKTVYSPKRPDIFISIKHGMEGGEKALCNWEVKHPWARKMAIEKDVSSTIKSILHFLRTENEPFRDDVPAHVKLGVAVCPLDRSGSTVTAYEVMRYEHVNLAVAVGCFELAMHMRP
ncbi:hypothetical protein HDU86_001282 [Geranomyces michiganensis]|nr:hypothetical protein HDU86_001282 [Geranomyces michiganensis]